MDRFRLFRPLYEHAASGARWPECVVEWAMAVLTEGTDTPNLRVLAGLPRGSSQAEVDEVLSATLAELDEPPISDAERGLGVARVIADAIVRGDVMPQEGVAAIHAQAVAPLDHPAALQPWCDLRSGFRRIPGSPKVEYLDGAALDGAVVAAARTFVAEDALEQLRRMEADPR